MRRIQDVEALSLQAFHRNEPRQGRNAATVVFLKGAEGKRSGVLVAKRVHWLEIHFSARPLILLEQIISSLPA